MRCLIVGGLMPCPTSISDRLGELSERGGDSQLARSLGGEIVVTPAKILLNARPMITTVAVWSTQGLRNSAGRDDSVHRARRPGRQHVVTLDLGCMRHNAKHRLPDPVVIRYFSTDGVHWQAAVF